MPATVNVDRTFKYIVVVDASVCLEVAAFAMNAVTPGTKAADFRKNAGVVGVIVPITSDDNDMAPVIIVTLVVACVSNVSAQSTSQSPAVSEILVSSALVEVVNVILEAGTISDTLYSPTLPSAALLFVVVPITPDVVLNVMLGMVRPAPTVLPMLGTPAALVNNMPLFAVAKAAITFALEAYKMVLIAFVSG